MISSASALVLALATSAALVQGYSLCNPSEYPYAGKNVSAPLVMALDSTSPYRASGSIRVVDGCTFEVVGFNYANGGTSGWYGGFAGDANGVTLSDTKFGTTSAATTQQFKFRTSAGSAVSYLDFNQFRLYDETNKILVATADIPAEFNPPKTGPTPGSTPPGGSTTPSTPTSPSAAAAKPSASPKSSASTASVSLLGLVLSSLLVL